MKRMSCCRVANLQFDLNLLMAKSSPLIHFEVPESIAGNYKAKCKYCGTFISGSEKMSSNFTTHPKVRKKHEEVDASYLF